MLLPLGEMGLGRSHLNLATCYPPQDLGGNREQYS